ncbi:hypothetical protein MNBD_IGNAVI01-550 [hydrothermal vent metagenome]|uniref:ABC transporter domain-containing protein n=1 Tax=hydrothermal vent metagenome TaxID=652676 RepID=A0A3B1C132_9ZZZZ
MVNVKLDFLEINSESSSTTLIENLEFQLTHNNIYTILGKNGTGKTTVILAITNLLDQHKFSYKGIVKFFGKDIFHLPQSELVKFRAENIRYVFQDPIGCLDPLKNIGYFFERFQFPEVEINEQFNYFQLPSYNKIKKLHPYELSVGMAQRVNIILSLLAKPKLLILDEPTSALDLPIANLLLERLKQFTAQDNNMVLIVTQDIVFAKKASDYIAVLDNKTLSTFQRTDELIDGNADSALTDFINTYNEIMN